MIGIVTLQVKKLKHHEVKLPELIRKRGLIWDLNPGVHPLNYYTIGIDHNTTLKYSVI